MRKPVDGLKEAANETPKIGLANRENIWASVRNAVGVRDGRTNHCIALGFETCEDTIGASPGPDGKAYPSTKKCENRDPAVRAPDAPCSRYDFFALLSEFIRSTAEA